MSPIFRTGDLTNNQYASDRYDGLLEGNLPVFVLHGRSFLRPTFNRSAIIRLFVQVENCAIRPDPVNALGAQSRAPH